MYIFDQGLIHNACTSINDNQIGNSEKPQITIFNKGYSDGQKRCQTVQKFVNYQ